MRVYFIIFVNFEIVKEYRDAEGYVNSKKVEIGFFDADDDGVVDNPDSFTDIVAEETDSLNKIIFLEKFTIFLKAFFNLFSSLNNGNITEIDLIMKIYNYFNFNFSI